MSKNKHRTFSQQNNRSTVFSNITFAIVSVFLLTVPYAKGLFHSIVFNFEKNINVFLLFGSILGIFASYILYRGHKENRLHWIYAAVWLIPISYLFAYITPLSSHSASLSILLYFSLTTVFVIGAFLSRQFLKPLAGVLLSSGYLVMLFGLAHWFGWSVYQDAVLQGRLSSVFQYANTNAIFSIALSSASTYLLLYETLKRHFWWPVALMVIPSFVSIMLTDSRGAILVWPIVVLAMLYLLPLTKQIMLLLHIAAAALISFAGIGYIEAVGLKLQTTYHLGQSLTGWAVLVACSFTYACIAFLLQKFISPAITRKISKWDTRTIFQLAIPSIILLFTVIGIFIVFFVPKALSFLPQAMQTKISSISFEQNSVLERFAFYKDAFNLFQDHMFFGAGGGAWANAYQAYQSNPYTSREEHSFFIKYLLETGIFGFSLLILGVIYILFKYVKTTNQLRKQQIDFSFVFYIFVVSILLHSMIDFNMSFVFISVIVFIGLGCMFESTQPGGTSLIQKLKSKWFNLLPATVAIVSLIFIFQSIRLIQASQEYELAIRSIQSKQSAEVTLEHISKAISLRPSHPLYHSLNTSLLSSFYEQTLELEYYNRGIKSVELWIKHQPLSPEPYSNRIRLEAPHSVDQALKYTNEALTLFPWTSNFYDLGIQIAFQLYLQSPEDAEKEQYRIMILDYLKEVKQRQDMLDQLPDALTRGRTFELKKESIEIINAVT